MNTDDHPARAAHPSTGVPPAEDHLHAWVDGRLSPEDAATLQAALSRDPASAATAQAWRVHRQALQTLHAGLLHEPAPPALLAAARRADAARHQVRQAWRWGGLAASVLLAFAAGWATHALGPSGASSLAAGGTLTRSFVRQAALAHVVYAPEQRHPVEVAAAEQDHLVQWLSKRLGRPLKLPQLAPQGWHLVGGRLLPGEDGARAQFMYQNAAGERITLYLGAVRAGGARAGETAFSFSKDGPVPSFYWVDQGFGYALAGPLPRQELMAIATAVYQQL
jgi:anti-sigma factor RsiW